MRDLSSRLKELIDTLEIRPSVFESRIHCSPGTIRKCIANKTTLTTKTLQSIKEKFPNVSIDWLISGSGSMFCDGTAKEENYHEKHYVTELQQYIDEIARLNGVISKQSSNLHTLFEVTEQLLSEINRKSKKEKE